MAVLCFPQCHRSGSLPTRKHLKSPFILLIGFSMFENAFPCLMKSALQDPLAAELGTGGAMYAVQTDDLGAGGAVSSSQVCGAACSCAGQVLLASMIIFGVLLLQASKAESAAAIHQLQDKEKMLAAMKEEAAVAKEQCKQLTQVNIKRFWCIESRGRGAGVCRTSSQ